MRIIDSQTMKMIDGGLHVVATDLAGAWSFYTNKILPTRGTAGYEGWVDATGNLDIISAVNQWNLT